MSNITSYSQSFANGSLTKETIINNIIALEGGYVHNKNDLGGETNFGVTKRVADANTNALVSKFGWNRTMRGFTKPMAFYIYEKDYWAKLKLDQVAINCIYLADKLFDLAVNIGVSRTSTWFQQILNVLNRRGADYSDIVADGIIGSKTFVAYNGLINKRGNKAASKTIIKTLICKQGSHYVDISLAREANEVFTYGWLERIDYHLVTYMNALK